MIETLYHGNLEWLPARTILFVRHGSHAYGTNIATSDTDYKGVAIPPYQNWRATRNEARAALEAKHGYDTKHAMHLVRLMRMCREILSTGTVLVKRPDAQDLLQIRGGAWSYDQLMEWAENQDQELEAVAATSPLPKQADRVKLDKLCIELVESAL